MFWQFSLFLSFWLLVSGSLDWQHLVFGSVIATLIAAFWHHTSERVVNRFSLGRTLLSLGAVISLAREVWLAAWQVVPLVLQRQVLVSPSLVQLNTCLKTNRMRAFYANSITLTPGTLTVQLKNDRLLVHALTEQAAIDVASWDFEKALQRLEETP